MEDKKRVRTPGEKLRRNTRDRLKLLEKKGNILDWDFVANEDVYFLTLLNGLEVEFTADQVMAFHIGYISAIMRGNTTGQGAMLIALRGAKIVSSTPKEKRDVEVALPE